MYHHGLVLPVVPFLFTRSATMAREASQSPMLVVIMVQGYYKVGRVYTRGLVRR